MTTPEVEKHAQKYCDDRGYSIDSRLGVGTQGSVYVVNIPSQSSGRTDQVAVKIHDREIAYKREVSVFERLKDHEVTHVCGHRVPIFIDRDDELLAIEMTVVSPPFCLDFGGAYLDRPPDYSPEVWRDWEEMKSDAFEENWPAVKKMLATFETFGVYIADVNPGNIKFK
jgi:hypothetical protein